MKSDVRFTVEREKDEATGFADEATGFADDDVLNLFNYLPRSLSIPWESIRRVWDRFGSIKEPQQLQSFLEDYGPIQQSTKKKIKRWDFTESGGHLTELPAPQPLLSRTSSATELFIDWSEFLGLKEGFEAEYLNQPTNPTPLTVHNFIWNQPLDLQMQFAPWGLDPFTTDPPINLTAHRARSIFRKFGIEVVIDSPPHRKIKTDDPEHILWSIWKDFEGIADPEVKSKIAVELFGEFGARKAIAGWHPWKRMGDVEHDENKIAALRSLQKEIENKNRHKKPGEKHDIYDYIPPDYARGIGRCPTALVFCDDVAHAIRANVILSRLAKSHWHRCKLAECQRVFEQRSRQITKFCSPEHMKIQNKREYVEKRRKQNLQAASGKNVTKRRAK